MKDITQERYVFWRFATQDFFECAETLELLENCEDNEVKMALFKAAVVAYARPFSGNKAVHKEQNWHINENWVTDIETHKLAIEYRSKLFAHTDITYRSPNLSKVGNRFPISMRGTYFEKYMELVEPLSSLSKKMISVLIDNIKEYEAKHF
jgi:6-phosphogluconate dehydrogenase